MWVEQNANPYGKRVGDCVVRALSVALGQSWDVTYCGICVKGFLMGDLPSANAVWGAYLWDMGFRRKAIEDKCPECYTVRDFCHEHPQGVYVLAISGHVVVVVDGHYIDTWDSGDCVPLYYWARSEK